MQKTINEPRVTILCFTYNQNKYIDDALRGFEKQTAFNNCEIIIHDDASTDGTLEKLRIFEKRHPNQVTVYSEKFNRFSRGDYGFFAEMFRYAKGDYIAWCEGDDYWLEDKKIEIQLEYMKQNPHCQLAFHKVKIIFENNRKSEIFPIMPKDEFTVDNLFNINFMQTNSVMYRKADYNNLTLNFMPIDWYMHIYHAINSNKQSLGYIDEIMSVYRINDKGVWFNSHDNPELFWKRHWKNHINLFEAMQKLAKNNIQEQAINKNKFNIMDKVQELKNGKKIMQDFINEYPELVIKYIYFLKEENAKMHQRLIALSNKKNRPKLIKRAYYRFMKSVNIFHANSK